MEKTNIIKEFGLEDLPEEKQAEIISKITETLLKKLMLTIMENLDPKDRTQLLKLQEKGDAKTIEDFLKLKIENYEELMSKTADQYREEMKTRIQDFKANL